MSRRSELGRMGEQYAAEYLIAKGYAILARNWRMGHLEVDIIGMEGDEVVLSRSRRVKGPMWMPPLWPSMRTNSIIL